MVAWIPDRKKHKILRTFALNFFKNYEQIEKPYQTSKECFIRYPSTLKSVARKGFLNVINLLK